MDVNLWSHIRQARLDVIQSQLDLEKSLVNTANDTGNSWDRWQQAIKEWQQREAELALRREYLDRQERLYQQKQAIRLDVLGARVDLLQADANRWTAWYNLQLARLDILRRPNSCSIMWKRRGSRIFLRSPMPRLQASGNDGSPG